MIRSGWLRGVALGWAAACVLMAQAPAAEAGRAGRLRGRMHRELMASYLGLTDDQRAKIKGIMESAREAAKPVREQLQQARKDLNAAIEAGKPVEALAATVGTLTGQLVAIRAKARVEMRAVLTPEQLAKQQTLRDRIRARRGGAGK